MPEAAEVLGMSQHLLRYHLRRNHIPSERIGRNWFIRESEVLNAVRDRRFARKKI